MYSTQPACGYLTQTKTIVHFYKNQQKLIKAIKYDNREQFNLIAYNQANLNNVINVVNFIYHYDARDIWS